MVCDAGCLANMQFVARSFMRLPERGIGYKPDSVQGFLFAKMEVALWRSLDKIPPETLSFQVEPRITSKTFCQGTEKGVVG